MTISFFFGADALAAAPALATPPAARPKAAVAATATVRRRFMAGVLPKLIRPHPMRLPLTEREPRRVHFTWRPPFGPFADLREEDLDLRIVGAMRPALADLTTLRLGGPAGRLLEASEEDAIVAAVRAADAAGESLLVMSGGSNLVVADAGFPGTVLRIASRGVRVDSNRLEVAAGEPWDPFVARCVAEGRAGIECLSGIPGSVGATPIQNVGAYGQEVSDSIVSVRAYDRARDRVEEIPAADCGFTYRSSAFKRNPGRWVVLAVTFALPRRPHSEPI